VFQNYIYYFQPALKGNQSFSMDATMIVIYRC